MKQYRIMFACILAALCLTACQRKTQEVIELSDEGSMDSSRYSRETAYFISPGYMLHTMFLKGQYNADSVTLEAFKGLQEDRQVRNILYGMDRHAFFT